MSNIYKFLAAIITMVFMLHAYVLSGGEYDKRTPAELYSLATKTILTENDARLIFHRLKHMGEDNPYALFILGEIYKDNTLPISEISSLSADERMRNAKDYYKMAADRYDVSAAMRLAEFAEKGIGQSANLHIAMYYYLVAGVGKNQEAISKLKYYREVKKYEFRSVKNQEIFLLLIGESPKKITSTQSGYQSRNAVMDSSFFHLTAQEKTETSLSKSPELNQYFRGFYSEIKTNLFNKCNGEFLYWFPCLLMLTWGVIGICLTVDKKIYAFDSKKDILLAVFLSVLFCAFPAMLIYNNFNNNELSDLLPKALLCMVGACLFGIPHAIMANPEKKWTVPLIIPAKFMIGIFLIFSAIGILCQMQNVITGKLKNINGRDLLKTGFFAGISFAIFSSVKKMTREYGSTLDDG